MISLARRELEERARSAREASQEKSRLSLSPQTKARYQNPPEMTLFPLEYAFYLLGDVNGKTVLEYGSGDGENTVVLTNRGASIIALDLSAEQLGVTRKRLEVNGCEEVQLLVGSAHNLPLVDDSVDIVFGMAILHHLDLEIASREVMRVLKKGGRAIFKEPTRNSKLIDQLRQLFPQRADVSPFERPLTVKEMREFAATCHYRARTFQLLF
jgi:ubiquinone/menaquinone biosynthesis C-methylase UbiE